MVSRTARITVWLFLVVLVLVEVWLFPDLFSIDMFISSHPFWSRFVYVLILSLVGLFFIPSTPLVLASIAFFPWYEVYFLSLIGIITSSMVVYYFSSYLGLDVFFEKKYPKQLKRIKSASKNRLFWIVSVWSATPFVPTDVMIYACSILRVSPKRCISAVVLGEGVLNIFYLLSAYGLLSFF